MSTNPPPIIISGPRDASPPPMADEPGARLAVVAALTVVAVLMQVAVLGYMRLGDGSPDIVAAVVVCIGLLRGRLTGAVAGFGGGLLVELIAPVDTLGAFALLYLIVGWFCGRYCTRPESHGVLPGVLLAGCAAGFVQLAYGAFQVADGRSLPVSEFAGDVMVPTLALTVLLFPLVLLVARKTLGPPHSYEPGLRI